MLEGIIGKILSILGSGLPMTVCLEILKTMQTTDQLSVLPYLILQKIMMSHGQWCKSCLFKLSSSATQNEPVTMIVIVTWSTVILMIRMTIGFILLKPFYCTSVKPPQRYSFHFKKASFWSMQTLLSYQHVQTDRWLISFI